MSSRPFFSELAGKTIRSPDFGFNNRDVLLLGELSRFRNSENVEMKDRLAGARGYLGSSLHNAEERGEDLTDFPGMFEPIIICVFRRCRSARPRRGAFVTLIDKLQSVD